MKKIVAYKCEYCGMYRISRTQIKNHEEICFKNPKSKSCITCEHLTNKYFIEGKVLTDQEEQILSFSVSGTYHEVNSGWDDQDSDVVLNDEYQYLYDAEQFSYCDKQKIILNKLRTQCKFY